MITESASLGQTYEKLNRRLFDAHAEWHSYRRLFATTQGRLDLLSSYIPGMTWQIHRALIDAVILGICRLSDREKLNGQRNLVFETLKKSLTPLPNAKQLNQLEHHLSAVKQSARDLRWHRDKRLAHNDFERATSPQELLPDITRESIEATLRSMRELMNAIKDWHQLPHTDYFVNMSGGADSLIWCLQQAARLDELQDDLHGRRLSDIRILEKLAERCIAEI